MSITLAALDQSRTHVEYRTDGSVRYKQWQVDGLPHRADGPARIDYYANGAVEREQWWMDGRWHRRDNPAVIGYYPNGSVKSQEWWENGHRHRLDGPASLGYTTDGSLHHQIWWVHGKRLTPQQQANLAEAQDPATLLPRLRQLVQSRNPAIRRAAILHPSYPQELRFLAQLEHPDWFGNPA